MAEMSMRERMLALVEGREHDRVPFVQYNGMAPNEEAWEAVGRNNLGLLAWCHVHRLEHPDCRFEVEEFEEDGQRGTRRTLHTPAGSLTEEKRNAAVAAASARHFVKEPEDYQVLLSYMRDLSVHKDLGPYAEACRIVGDDGLPHVSLGRSPYQQLWVEWVSLEDLALHLVDCPGLMEEVFAAMFAAQRAIFRVVREAADELPLVYVNFPDNVTAPMIGDTYFRRYCVACYQELADLLADCGREILISVHMDGDLKPLWGAIGDSPVRHLDSFSPPPDNDTSVADVVRLWPEMRIGVNFPSSVHIRDPEHIYAAAMEILEQGGRTGRLQIQISENLPPERWRVSYPEIARAIRHFSA